MHYSVVAVGKAKAPYADDLAHYSKLLELARKDEQITECHSVEEAVERHEGKKRHRGTRAARKK